MANAAQSFLESLPPHDENASTLSQRAALSLIQETLLRHRENVEKRVGLLRKQRDDSASAVSRTTTVLAFPNEITSAIFVACLPGHGRVRPSAHRAPLLVAQICRQWRAVALATTELWCSLDVELRRGPRRRGVGVMLPGNQKLIETWASRAGARPLSLTIRGPGLLDHEQEQRLPAPNALPFYLCRYPRRLGKIEADVSADQLLQLLPAGNRFPNLTHVAGPFALKDPGLLARVSPKLESLHLRECTPKMLAKLSSTRLKSLRLGHRITLSCFLDVASRCPCLEDFEGNLRLTNGCRSKYSGRAITTLPNLTSFDVADSDCGLFDFLTLPSLSTLRFAICSHMDRRPSVEDPVAIMSEFLQRSSCLVTTLALNAAFRNASVTQIADCLRLFSSVEILGLQLRFSRRDEFPPPSWRSLAASLPLLRELELSVEPADDHATVNTVNYSALIQMVSRQNLSLPPLTKLLLKVRDELDWEWSWEHWHPGLGIPPECLPSRLHGAQLGLVVGDFTLKVSTFVEDPGSESPRLLRELCWPPTHDDEGDLLAEFHLHPDNDWEEELYPEHAPDDSDCETPPLLSTDWRSDDLEHARDDLLSRLLSGGHLRCCPAQTLATITPREPQNLRVRQCGKSSTNDYWAAPCVCLHNHLSSFRKGGVWHDRHDAGDNSTLHHGQMLI
uniref:F-box domain-containing protein n=1 Tax=Mycena chlorophos TaxID=658473 RepID=A0ABQ0M185_MYCCL|nr:predicted protein [Mycena chlorophos]